MPTRSSNGLLKGVFHPGAIERLISNRADIGDNDDILAQEDVGDRLFSLCEPLGDNLGSVYQSKDLCGQSDELL